MITLHRQGGGYLEVFLFEDDGETLVCFEIAGWHFAATREEGLEILEYLQKELRGSQDLA